MEPSLVSEIADIEYPRVKPACLDVDDRRELLKLIESADVVVELLPIRYTISNIGCACSKTLALRVALRSQ